MKSNSKYAMPNATVNTGAILLRTSFALRRLALHTCLDLSASIVQIRLELFITAVQDIDKHTETSLCPFPQNSPLG